MLGAALWWKRRRRLNSWPTTQPATPLRCAGCGVLTGPHLPTCRYLDNPSLIGTAPIEENTNKLHKRMLELLRDAGHTGGFTQGIHGRHWNPGQGTAGQGEET